MIKETSLGKIISEYLVGKKIKEVVDEELTQGTVEKVTIHGNVDGDWSKIHLDNGKTITLDFDDTFFLDD